MLSAVRSVKRYLKQIVQEEGFAMIAPTKESLKRLNAKYARKSLLVLRTFPIVRWNAVMLLGQCLRGLLKASQRIGRKVILEKENDERR
jgi:hypothetical protein